MHVRSKVCEAAQKGKHIVFWTLQAGNQTSAEEHRPKHRRVRFLQVAMVPQYLAMWKQVGTLGTWTVDSSRGPAPSGALAGWLREKLVQRCRLILMK